MIDMDLQAAAYGNGEALPGVSDPSPAGDPEGGKQDEEMLDATAARIVQEDYSVGKRLQSELQKIRDRNYQLYRAQTMGNERPGRSQVVSSDVMDQLEWLMPSLMRVFFATENVCYAEPMTGSEEDLKRAKLGPALLNEQYVTHNNGFLHLYKWAKDAGIFKIGFTKITWREDWTEDPHEQAEMTEEDFAALQQDPTIEILSYEQGYRDVQIEQPAGIDPMTGQPVMAPVVVQVPIYTNVRWKQAILVYEGPNWEVTPPEDLLYDPEAESLKDARWVIHRVHRRYSFLKDQEAAGIYKNIDKVKAGSSGGRVNTEAETEKALRYAEEGRSAPFNLVGNQQSQEMLDEYELLEWWGLLQDPEDKDRPAPYVVTVCNGVTIRRERNPYDHGESPFEDLVLIPDIHKMEGISIPEMSGEFQEINTAITRQYLDNLSWQNNGMWEMDRNAQVEIESLKNPRPGGIVRTNRIGSVSPLRPPYIGDEAIRAIQFFDDRHEKRTGQTKYSQGLDANSLNKTATGITQIMQRSDMRTELIARIVADGLRRAFRKAHSLNRQFLSQKTMIRLFDEPLEIAPDDVKGTLDIRITVGVSAAKEQEVSAQVVQLLQMCPGYLQAGVIIPDFPHFLFGKLMEQWHWKDYKATLPAPNYIQGLQQQLAQYQQQMAQAAQLIQVMQQKLVSLGVAMPNAGPNTGPGVVEAQNGLPPGGGGAGTPTPEVVPGRNPMG